MRTALLLLSVLAAMATSSALAQTKVPAKPAPKNSKASTPKLSTTKPAGSAQPAPSRSTQTRPAPQPTPASQPAQPVPAAAPKLEIPGIAAQQAPSFVRGTTAVNLGIGMGIGYGYGFGYGGSLKSSPALSLSVEKGVLDGIGPGTFSVGGLVGYKSYTYEYAVAGDSYQATWRNIYLAARGAYHYNFTADSRVDTYAGVSLAARLENYSNDYAGSTPNSATGGTKLEVGVFLGGRYLLTENLGAFAELGYDMSYLKLGLTSRF